MALEDSAATTELPIPPVATSPEEARADMPKPIPEAPLSKKARKKLEKRQRTTNLRAQKKIEKRNEKKREQVQRFEAAKERLQQMSEEEQLAWNEARLAKKEVRKRDAVSKKARMQQAMQAGPRIIIDLDFDDKMTESEVKSLCQQLAYCYSANTHSSNPAHLHLTSLTGRIGATLAHQSAGLENWIMSRSEESYDVALADQKQDLVYLTADAAETLEALDPCKAYIIGGIVDRNRYKRLCQEKAEKQGLRTARLPIDAHLKLTGTRVLTVNQVVAILVCWQESKDWKVALEKVIPIRKVDSKDAAAAAPAAAAANGGSTTADEDGSVDSANERAEIREEEKQILG